MGVCRRRGVGLTATLLLVLTAEAAGALDQHARKSRGKGLLRPSTTKMIEQAQDGLVDGDAQPTAAPPSPPRSLTEQCLVIEMKDSYGDGWNGATYIFTNSEGGVEATGTLASGASGTDALCNLSSRDRCYTLTVTAGSYPSEISWEVSRGGVVMAEGGGSATVDNVCNTPWPTITPTATPWPTTVAIDTYSELANSIERGAEQIMLAPGAIEFPAAITIGLGYQSSDFLLRIAYSVLGVEQGVVPYQQ